MSLATYRKKRDFRKTAEPAGAASRQAKSGHSFVVQKHDASHLHYDFRLEVDGVLKSWAVPKGPSLDPKIKRLAVEVEDHPLEYGGFEGTIPQGEYGGGTVLLWDRGTWEPDGDEQQGLRAGRLKFQLTGEKLRGKWMLVRSRTKSGSKPQWLLFKLPDAEAKAESREKITESSPLSVASGRGIEEIASGKRGKKVAKAQASRKRAAAPREAAAGKRAKRAVSGKLPRHIVPQLPTLVESAPTGEEWFHEVKFDGYRLVCWIDGEKVRLETRNQLDWTSKFPELAEALGQLGLQQTILDGELVAINDAGISDFGELQSAIKEERTATLLYTAFDLLFHDGQDLRSLPLEERKSRLEALGFSTTAGLVRYTEHLIGEGEKVFEQAKKAGLEGIVSKRRDQPYLPGRGTTWLKTKTHEAAEFVIGGYTEPAGSRQGFGALLLGYYEDKKLRYAGKVGTGFGAKTLRELKQELSALEREKPSFTPLPTDVAGRIHWIRPELVANIQFSNWTRDHLLRHPVFQGLRQDKAPTEVKRDVARQDLARRPASRAKRKVAAATVENPVATSDGAALIEGVRITHPDKLLWPDDKISKRDLALYYQQIAPQILPFIVDRPLSLVRCPDGVDQERFFQKHPGPGAPAELDRVKLREGNQKAEEYFVVKDVAGLIALTQIAAVELHVWGAKIDRPEKPDQMVLDLDPSPEVAWREVVQAAIDIRRFLSDLGLVSFVKTSGGKGLHLVVPLQRVHSWGDLREFSEQIAVSLATADPDRFTANMSKKARVGKIYVDYLRNQREATSAVVFSTRANAGAPVSFPVEWKNLARVSGPAEFTLRTSKTVLLRPFWKGYHSVKQRVTGAMMRQLK